MSGTYGKVPGYMSIHATAPLLTPREVCDELRISRATFYRLVENRELPSVRVGGQIRVSQAELERRLFRNSGGASDD